MRKSNRNKPGSNWFDQNYLTPKASQSGDDTDLRTIVSTETEMRDAERPLRELIRAAKAVPAISEMATRVSCITNVNIRDIEPIYIRGKKNRNATSKGHEAVYGTQEQKEIGWRAMQEAVDRLRKANPESTKADVRIKAAEEFNCHWITIKRNTMDPGRTKS